MSDQEGGKLDRLRRSVLLALRRSAAAWRCSACAGADDECPQPRHRRTRRFVSAFRSTTS